MSYIDPSVTPSGLVGMLEAPNGGLYGNVTLINVATAPTWVTSPMRSTNTRPRSTTRRLARSCRSSACPRLRPPALVLANGTAYSQDFTASPSLGSAGARAVASVYMHSSVMNDYILDTATVSNTDWVMTFPVKREFVNATTAGAPFTAVMTSSGACEPRCSTSSTATSRASRSCLVDSRPAVGRDSGHGQPVLGIDRHQRSQRAGAHDRLGTNSGVLGSRNTWSVTAPQNFQNGWMMVTFTGAGATGADGGVPTFGVGNRLTQTAGSFTTLAGTFVGLPVTASWCALTNNAIDCTRVAWWWRAVARATTAACSRMPTVRPFDNNEGMPCFMGAKTGGASPLFFSAS
jgi:hypothetical protein